MFWSKKEEKSKLPSLPPLKPEFSAIPQFPVAKEVKAEERNALPSFPEPMEKGFSQAAIKTAVSTQEIGEGIAEESKTIEMEEWHPENLPPPSREPFVLPIAKRRHDVYIKIDKFQSAKHSLDEAKENLEQIDELLRKIRETKMREEQELMSWEKELTAVKARIQNISENIFEK